MATWADIQRGIFAGESGGDYGALFNYQNRPDGRFSGVDLTQMSVDDALQFADPSGPYAQYVKSQVGRVATPMGAYQVVGKTLRAAKEGLGLTGNERMTPELQDRIGQWIYKEQGTGAWKGYKGPRVSTKEGSMMDDNNMNAGTTAEQAAAQAAAASAAMQEQSTSDKYKDIAGNLAVAFNSMRLNPDPALASTINDIRTARTEKQAKNKTLAYLEKIGRKDLVNAIGAGLSPREAIAQMFSEAAELRGFNRQKELIDYKAGLEQPKTYEYQQLAKDLLSQGIAKTEQEALQMALSQNKPAAPSVQVSYGDKGGPPKAFEKVDDEFAKTYVKWGSGGAADAVKNLNQIKGVIKDINLAAKEGRTTSGPLVGIQNDVVQSFLNPEATDIRNRVQEVVQRNLREILGAQFTQNEAAQLIDRAYNQRLSPEMNLRRLNALLDQMSQAATATQQMYDHFKTNGTLFGYEGGGTLPTKEDLHGLMDYFDAQQGVDTSDLRKGAPSKSSTISQADALVGIK